MSRVVFCRPRRRLCADMDGDIHTQTHALMLIINDTNNPTLVVGEYDKVPMRRVFFNLFIYYFMWQMSKVINVIYSLQFCFSRWLYCRKLIIYVRKC